MGIADENNANAGREAELVKERYSRRKRTDIYDTLGRFFYYNFYYTSERELRYGYVLRKKYGSARGLKIMEIGAGSGSNLLFFRRLGIAWKDIYANELLEDRVGILKENLPMSVIHPGNALDLDYKEHFDIVFQSTVFTSVLSPEVKRQLAEKMLDMTRPGGMVLWYDFRFNNPSNKDVRGISRKEIRQLFGTACIDFYPVTLAPPVGRRLGRLYPVINFLFPFLRSHIIAVIHKPG